MLVAVHPKTLSLKVLDQNVKCYTYDRQNKMLFYFLDYDYHYRHNHSLKDFVAVPIYDVNIDKAYPKTCVGLHSWNCRFNRHHAFNFLPHFVPDQLASMNCRMFVAGKIEGEEENVILVCKLLPSQLYVT